MATAMNCTTRPPKVASVVHCSDHETHNAPNFSDVGQSVARDIIMIKPFGLLLFWIRHHALPLETLVDPAATDIACTAVTWLLQSTASYRADRWLRLNYCLEILLIQSPGKMPKYPNFQHGHRPPSCIWLEMDVYNSAASAMHQRIRCEIPTKSLLLRFATMATRVSKIEGMSNFLRHCKNYCRYILAKYLTLADHCARDASLSFSIAYNVAVFRN